MVKHQKMIYELLQLRIAYVIDDFGSVTDYEKQLIDYFERN